MSTSQNTIDYLLDQLESVGGVTARKMFGEYAIYCRGKVVGLVCDNIFYVKITTDGLAFVGDEYCEGHAFPGAKASIMINGDRLEERDWLCELISITEAGLPLPRFKPNKYAKKLVKF